MVEGRGGSSPCNELPTTIWGEPRNNYWVGRLMQSTKYISEGKVETTMT